MRINTQHHLQEAFLLEEVGREEAVFFQAITGLNLGLVSFL